MEPNDVVTLIRGAVKSGRRTDDVIDAKSTFWQASVARQAVTSYRAGKRYGYLGIDGES
jgi:hypothetical protein